MYNNLKSVGSGESIVKIEVPLNSCFSDVYKIKNEDSSDHDKKKLIITTQGFSDTSVIVVQQVCLFSEEVFNEICNNLNMDTTIEIELDGIPIPINTRNIQRIS